MADDTTDEVRRSDFLHDDLMSEYYRIADTVAGFDQRLLTMKSWGVTFALATLALGFQQDHYGLFLVASCAALGFWLIEWSTKKHQMRYYPRMGDIEAIAYELYGLRTRDGVASSPLIDWSWHTAATRIWGQPRTRFMRTSRSGQDQQDITEDPQVPQRWPDVCRDPGANGWILLWPHVAFPHAIAVVLGMLLFVLGLFGVFGPI